MDARIFGIAAAVFLTAWISPTKIQRVDFRAINFASPIVCDKSSPAYSALEDSRENYLLPANVKVNNAQKLILFSFRSGKLSAPLLAQSRQLRPLVISESTPVDHLARLIASTLEDPPAPTMTELGEVLVREELVRRATTATTNKNVREITTASGHNIIVARPGLINAARFLRVASSSPAQGSKASGQQIIKREISVPANRKPQLPSVAQNNNSNNNTVSSMEHLPSPPARFVISGPLSFGGGAAFLGPRNSVTTNQIIDGLSTASGIVDLKDASYEIAVEELAGEIVAEVRGQDGQIMGQGFINLNELAGSNRNDARIKNLALEVRPVFNGASGTTISAASDGSSKYVVSDAKVYVDGLSREVARNKKSSKFEDETLAMPSTYILRGTHENFWPTLSFAESGEKFELRLFPVGLIDALLNLSLNKYEAREAKNEAVIWGRVSMMGRAVEGARVYIVGESSKEANYFSGYIPDKTKTSTTGRGEFAFTRVKSEETLLRISLADKFLLPTMIPTEGRHVTYADLEVEPGRAVEIKSFDAFTAQPIPAALQPLGTKENMIITESGITQVHLDTVKGMTLIESDPGEPYVVSRMALKSAQAELNFPQVKTEWLKNLAKNSLNIKGQESATSIVGFISGDNFEVLIGDGSSVKNPNIVYFDANGAVLSSAGTAGGGFVVFGLPRGLNTLTIIPEKSKKIVTQTIYVDEYATNISQINLMF